MERIILDVSGMSCNHCVARVTTALNGVHGVQVENVAIGSAAVAYDPAATSPSEIAKAVTDAGYAAQPAGQAA